MVKNYHEIRDPIHTFIKLSSKERMALNSKPLQRLRHIHQLALTYLVYPGATHTRFEHSLGVMELASRVYDVITSHLTDEIKDKIEELARKDDIIYWRKVIRMAALMHDIGHLPFSHAAEKNLLPDDWTHETLTNELIKSPDLQAVWNKLLIRPDHVSKIALGPKELPEEKFTPLQTILSEIIVGDAFGVDRMDYLLRDSHHIGVVYGKFDHYRLIDTLRILPDPISEENGINQRFSLGVTEGGIHSAEALMLARYFMYTQVYFHHVRRAYDIHLREFMKAWLPETGYPIEPERHLAITDSEVTTAMREAEKKPSHKGHIHAKRIIQREHFKRIYSRNPNDAIINPDAGEALYNALRDKFGKKHFYHDRYHQKGASLEFPVRMSDGQVNSSYEVSDVIRKTPKVNIDYVFASRKLFDQASEFIKEYHDSLIEPKGEEG